MESAAIAHGAHAHGPPEAHRSSRIEPQPLGVYLFIISEAMLFGSFFTAYFFVRVVANEEWPPPPFHFPVNIALMNTFILVFSSVVMHWALVSIKRGNRTGLQAGLAITFMMGAIFLATQINEYVKAGFSISDGAFASVFYGLTGTPRAPRVRGPDAARDGESPHVPRAFLAKGPHGSRDGRDLLALRRRHVDNRVPHRLHPLVPPEGRGGLINPLRSEEDAFRFTVVVAILVAPIALTAIVFSSEAGLAVAGGLLFGIAFTLFVLRRDEAPKRATLRQPERGEQHRILVVANETLSGAALRDEIEHRAGGEDTEVFVVCPALNTKLKTWTSDDDGARARAHARLQGMLDALDRDGFKATGDIGDGDPVQALEDGLRVFGADEVIVSTHPPGRSNWLERDVVERARERFDVPITHVIVDLERERDLSPPPTT